MAQKKADKIVTKEEIVRHAMDLAAQLGWGHVTLTDIALAAGLSLAELRAEVADKFDILAQLGRLLDQAALDGAGQGDIDASPRDRLFDVLMERFEALNDYRDGIVSVLQSFRCDPKQAVISCPHVCRSMAWMLEAAGEDTNGIKGAVKVAGLTGVYLKVLRVWAADDSSDLGKTMAALDKELARAEKLAGMVGF
ncbi:MAG: TetR family transcriptional regulator [Bdellovibrionales bacterium]